MKDMEAHFPGVVLIHQKISGYEMGAHLHEEHELFLPLQGEIALRAGGLSLKGGPGKMIYLPPGTEHSFRSSRAGSGERLIVILEAKAWEKYGGALLGPRVASVSQLAQELLFHLLLHPETKAAAALLHTLVSVVSETLEGAVVGTGSVLEAKARDPRLKKALAELNDHFAENLPVARLAKAAGLSARNLNRLFLSELGLSPKQVVTALRMEAAKALLTRGRPVTDVALEVGYGSLSQFISTFRKATGQLPSAFGKVRGPSSGFI